MEGYPRHSRRLDRDLQRDRAAHRQAEGGAGGRARLRLQRDCARHSLPPRGAHRWIDGGLSLGRCAQARAADAGEGGMTAAVTARRERAVLSAPRALAGRIAALDWTSMASELDAHGCVTTGALLGAEECAALAQTYGADAPFRSRVIMARHGFGRGEYKYFAYPLPEVVAALRGALYRPLADIANRWNEALGISLRYPGDHAAYLTPCHRAGQAKPTPLRLQYGPGDYNCLHQDLYGEHVFPLQVTFLLSRPGEDFSGGEFVLTEQRPRMQS